MGLFDKLFSGDPGKDLDKAVAQLARGENEKALKRALRVAEKEGPLAERARDLAERARERIVTELVNNANRSESAGSYDDAADWLSSARPHFVDPEEREACEARIATLRERAVEVDQVPVDDVESEVPGEEEVPLDEETHFITLVSTLRSGVAAQYDAMPPAFRSAFIKINTNRIGEAETELRALIEAHGESPVLLFESARCAFFQNRNQEARELLEKVGNHFGDGALDLAGTYSVPGIWAQSMLRLDKAAGIVDRLAPIADPALGVADVTMAYVTALEYLDRREEAIEMLAPARKAFPGNPWFPFHLARNLDELGEGEQAAQVLERSVAPSCTTGACAAPPKHIPSIRYLIALYLGQQRKPERVEELLDHLERGLQGRFQAEDLRLLAAYHRQQGDERAAAAAEEAAEKTT